MVLRPEVLSLDAALNLPGSWPALPRRPCPSLCPGSSLLLQPHCPLGHPGPLRQGLSRRLPGCPGLGHEPGGWAEAGDRALQAQGHQHGPCPTPVSPASASFLKGIIINILQSQQKHCTKPQGGPAWQEAALLQEDCAEAAKPLRGSQHVQGRWRAYGPRLALSRRPAGQGRCDQSWVGSPWHPAPHLHA